MNNFSYPANISSDPKPEKIIDIPFEI